MQVRKFLFRNFKIATLLITAGTLMVSCEKVIDINLNKANPKYVIEANISDFPGECRVVLTQSVNFSEPSDFPAVKNASVFIQVDNNEPVKLRETTAGLFVSDTLRARPGKTYTLTVNVGDEQFNSTVKAPRKSSFDSLYIFEFSGFGDTRKFANVQFQDNEGLGNAYRFLQYKNKVRNPNIFVINDDYSDGRVINTFLAFFDNSDGQRLDTGDTLLVEMQSIDPSIYKFFMSLSQSSTGGNSDVAPGNPVSNIKGGALGYFNVFMRQRKSLIVP